MTVKFNMHIRIDADQFMEMIAQYLPFELQSVEEIVVEPLPKAPPAVVALANRFKAKRGRPSKPSNRKPTKPMDLKAGINRILLEALADGKPHKAIEIRPMLVAGGFSPNSVGSRLQYLAKKGLVTQHGDGTWTIHRPVGVVPEE